jgi:alkyl hydroperoxide reductase subunit AhpC
MPPTVMQREYPSRYASSYDGIVNLLTVNLQIRTVFVIDPKKVIRLTLAYPASTGRNFDEIIRYVPDT